MKKYIDGFLIPVHPEKLEEYKRLATLSSQVWMDHGALQYIEAAGDDLKPCTPDSKTALELLGAEPGETLVFAYIVYESREHRDEVNAKVFEDPRMKDMCDGSKDIFDFKRMITGGFRVIVEG